MYSSVFIMHPYTHTQLGLSKGMRNLRTASIISKLCRAYVFVLNSQPLPSSLPTPVHLQIVKKMMDLGTVKKKLERGQYSNAAECAADIRLIWDNCKLYNMQGSDFHLLAESFSRRFEDRYKKICADYDTGEGAVGVGGKAGRKSLAPGGGSGGGGAKSSRGRGSSSMSPTPSGPITLDARVALGAKIFKLSGMELGHAINIIELRCPEALVGCGGGTGTAGGADNDGLRTDELEVDIDSLDSSTFNEVSRYVSEALSNGGRSSVVDDYSRGTSVAGGGRSRTNSRASSAAAVEDDEEEEEEFEYEEEEEEDDDEEEIAVAEEIEPEWDEDDDEIIVKHQTKKRRKSKD